MELIDVILLAAFLVLSCVLLIARSEHECWREGCYECSYIHRLIAEGKAQVGHDRIHSVYVDGCRLCEERKERR